ncbi:MAG TPA: hypothetical protein VNF50_11400 [Acidimicrobiales bacterium]|nr:hypothetical protein [Acidimicrobiales bacterium]
MSAGASSWRGVTIALRLAAAAALGASAAIHIHLWDAGYRHIPTIGPLFLLQAIVGALLALAVLAVPPPWSALAGLAGAGFLFSTVAGLILSVEVGLFGFKDSFSAPYAKASLAVEVFGAVLGLASGGWALRTHPFKSAGPSAGSKEKAK